VNGAAILAHQPGEPEQGNDPEGGLKFKHVQLIPTRRRHALLVPGIPALCALQYEKTWTAGTSPGMTEKRYPRPTNGIVFAITVMNSTFESSGRLAM
jgi:hypothetical protein